MIDNFWFDRTILEKMQEFCILVGVVLPLILSVLDFFYENKKRWKLFIALSIAILGVVMLVVNYRVQFFEQKELSGIGIKLRQTSIKLEEQKRLTIEAQQELERLKSKFAWRTIPDDKKSYYIAKLSYFKGQTVRVDFVNSPESSFFKERIVLVFNEAGLRTVNGVTRGSFNSVMIGGLGPGDFYLISGKNRLDLAKVIRGMLTNMGLKEGDSPGDEVGDNDIILGILPKIDKPD